MHKANYFGHQSAACGARAHRSSGLRHTQPNSTLPPTTPPAAMCTVVWDQVAHIRTVRTHGSSRTRLQRPHTLAASAVYLHKACRKHPLFVRTPSPSPSDLVACSPSPHRRPMWVHHT